MTSSTAFVEVKDGISAALVETTRTAGQISNEDLAFQRSSNPALIPLLERQSSRLLSLAKALTKVATSGTEVAAPKISDVESIDDHWRSIVDVFDNLLEKADACLDDYTGVIKRLSPSQEEQIKKAALTPQKQKPGKAYRTQNIAKPQLQFEHAPANDAKTPFKPLLKSKPHAIVSLEHSLQLVPSEDGLDEYRNPYETEIKAAQTPPSVHLKSNPIPSLPYESTAAIFVDTPEAVRTMMEELKQAQEIAIDLEHHDEHSYIGLVCLMQISSREKDWVVDTLKSWRRDLQMLNEVFTDPKILKVFHGSNMDMIWLQRDLGLYVVGLFDTFHASWALGYPKHSLAFLLKKFVNFDAAKQYQMADWRIRPLPDEMFSYARSDTHFLLYVYDLMRNELVEESDLSQPDGNLIEYVMEHSKKESLQRYQRPFYDKQRGMGPLGWYSMLYRTPALFNREQFAVFRAVHQWRDQVAREEDEGLHTVMPKRVLYSIAREMPADMASLLGCSHPMSKAYQKRKDQLLEIVKQAKVDGATGPEMKDFWPEAEAAALRSTSTSISRNKRIVTFDAESGSHGVLPVKSDTSAFWGPLIADVRQPKNHMVEEALNDLHLTLPLPQLTAEVFVDMKMQSDGSTTVQRNPGARVEHEFIKDRKPRDDEVFIARQSGASNKRKSSGSFMAPAVDALDANGDLVSGHQDEEKQEVAFDGAAVETERLRADGKREQYERRLERKRMRHEKAPQTVEADKGLEVEPFDYANAPSILHAKKTQDSKKTSAHKEAHPYSKSLDAPKGMRKSQKEIAGKSFTFKK